MRHASHGQLASVSHHMCVIVAVRDEADYLSVNDAAAFQVTMPFFYVTKEQFLFT